MVTPADLQALAQSLSVVLDGPSTLQPGQKVVASLSPSISTLKVTDTLSGALDLTFITKGVRFSNTGTEASPLTGAGLKPNIINGMPIIGIVGNVGSVNDVPGTLGQVTGNIPLGAVQTPVTVAVTWAVLDGAKNPLAINQFTAPDGLTSPSASFVFLPPLVELEIGMDLTPASRFIRATVTLSVGAVSSGPQALPDIPIGVVPLPIPTIFSLFRFVDFRATVSGTRGTVLVVVPSASLLKSFADVQSSLNNLQSVVSQLSAFANFATFATRLGMLVSALNGIAALDQSPITRVLFTAADSLANLQDFVYERSFGSWGWITLSAEDSMNALIFVGPAGETMECTNARSFVASAEGQFTVTIGTTAGLPDMFVTAHDLTSVAPPSDPAGTLVVTAVPPGSQTFGDNLSSLRFIA